MAQRFINPRLTENVQEICKKQKKEGEKMLVFYVGSTCKDRVILFHTLNYFINVARKLLKDGLVQWRRDLLIQGSESQQLLNWKVFSNKEMLAKDAIDDYCQSQQYKDIQGLIQSLYYQLVQTSDEFQVRSGGWQQSNSIHKVVDRIIRLLDKQSYEGDYLYEQESGQDSD
eukprot:TRINITY_DN658_c4_g1_i6.p3 TRINITY_DN658_c4_g1~~TRINITY_DN658_c4_g1_i6.p3  ORF type:complete len:171 (-),score=13.22 TRINITY_DN658_c4_g1_i6:346-858(-)